MTKSSLSLVLLALALSGPALAQYSSSSSSSSTTSSTATSCPTTISAAVAAPSVAAGFEASLVANGLYKPRGIAFDGHGHLLVLEQTAGIVALDLSDAGRSCVTSPSRHVVVNDTSLNHAIILSPDNTTLYTSSPEAVTAYAYNSTTARVTDNGTIIIANMTTDDHTTRTLLLSRFVNGLLVVTRGSTSNIDPLAEDVASGHSEIKAFNLLNRTAIYNFNTDGLLLGWGLRNDVGIDEHPVTGELYSVENSADDITRYGVDVHVDNPAEELNSLGYLNGTHSPNQGGNFGYPLCFTAWQPSALPNNTGIETGTPFAIGYPNATSNDTLCRTDTVAPRLSFQAHQAPLDILFNPSGSEAYVSWHGSWDRSPPVGYKISMIQYNQSTGSPLAPANSTTAAIDIVANQNITACPKACFRPVGLAWDSTGRLFFSSDATGEIYVVARNSNGSVASYNPSSSSATATAAATSSTTNTGAAASATSAKPSGGWRIESSAWFMSMMMLIVVILEAGLLI